MKTRKLLAVIVSLTLLFGVLSASSQADPLVDLTSDTGVPLPIKGQDDTMAKVETLVLDELDAQGETDFFVWIAEKADLRPALALETKAAKGQFVFQTLRETAQLTQKGLTTYLDAQGAQYRPYYITNKILIRGGTRALLDDIAARPEVEKITANHTYQLKTFPIEPAPDPVPLVESNIRFVNADDVWALGYTGEGVVLAGNDTGLDWDHPALINQYRGWNGSTADHNYNWWDATGTYPTVPNDGHGHGTHTTGTMVGDDGGSNQIGMAPGAKTIHCKNMTNGGSGSDATFTECFEWDLAPWDLNGQNPRPDLAPNAINNSWGYWGGNRPQFEDEIAALQAAGILVEVSAGNEGPPCWTLRSPGDYDQVLTTGSVNHAGGVLPGTLTTWSSRGPSDLYPGAYIPDVMAPGQNIRSSLPGGGYASWNGTSMAGPHVTGLVGLLWSANPNLRGRVAETVQIIQDTAVPLTGQGGSNCGGDYVDGPNNDWGYGTIDALAAVNAALSNTCVIDLVNDTHNCWLVPAIDFVLEPTAHKTVLKVNLDPSQYGYNRAVFDVVYGGPPDDWTVNIGDSKSNNGYGGDSAHQSNDAEMQIRNTTLGVWSNDYLMIMDVRNMLNLFNVVSQGDTISLQVADRYLGWGGGELRSPYLYALDGQPDDEGPVNYDIYAGFNRSIWTASRDGSGVTEVTVTLNP